MPHRLMTSSSRVLLGILCALVSACDAPPAPVSGSAGLQVERRGYLPVIESIAPEKPAPGDKVALRGYFHTPRKNEGLFVSFNGIDSRSVTWQSEALLEAVVPEGATSGNVVVVMGESVSKGVYFKIRDKRQQD